MDLRALGFAVAAGVATFLVVGVLVTENLSAAIEYSLFLGVPAGTVAGLAVLAFVYTRLGSDDPTIRQMAIAGAGFGVAFLAVAIVGVAFAVPHSFTFPIATAAAIVGAAVAFVRF